MKHSRFVMTMALLIGVMGCSVKESMDTTDEPFQVVFEATPFLDGDAGEDTKTYVTPNANYSAYEFFWSAQDTVGIFPSQGNQVAFSMASGAGASSATFDGGAWTCKVGYTYRSYYPLVREFDLDPTGIPVTFKGMKQVGNANSDHFRQCDYMYAPATTKEGNYLNFSYQHLIAAVLPWVELPAGHYTKLTLSLDEPLFVTKGEYDLTAATPAIVGTQFSNTLSIDLDVTFANAETLIAYVPIAPMNMTGKTLTITVTRDNGIPYQYTYVPGKPYAASNIYRLRAPNSMVDHSTENITFADSKVKEKLVAAFDANSDGEISYEEAAAVTSSADLKAAFGAIKTYKSFDEFQFFTGITSVPDNMFEEWVLLTSVILPDNIVYVGSNAFKGCVKLASPITIPESVTFIGNYAFYGCTGLTSITIPDGVTSIGDSAFQNCTGLTSVTISEGVTSIGDRAFYYCSSLTSISIPEGVTSIGEYAFYGCTGLTSVIIPDSVTNMPDAFVGCTGLTSIIIGDSVANINTAFYGCTGLTSVTIPESVTNVWNAFSGCTGLTSVSIPDSVTFLYGTFQNCTGLTSVTIPESVTDVMHAFSGCTGLTSVIIGDSVTHMSSAFEGCTSLTSVTIPNSVTYMANAFSGCTGLTSVTIPNSVTDMSSAFEGCTSLTSVTIPNSVTNMANAFSGCTGLTSVTIPNSVTDIRSAFENCTGLTSVTISEGVTSIGDRAFYYCSSLTSISIPEGVTSIGGYAFYGCTGLTSITVLAIDVPSCGLVVFPYSDNCPIYVPPARVDAYKTAENWSDYANRIQAIPE